MELSGRQECLPTGRELSAAAAGRGHVTAANVVAAAAAMAAGLAAPLLAAALFAAALFVATAAAIVTAALGFAATSRSGGASRHGGGAGRGGASRRGAAGGRAAARIVAAPIAMAAVTAAALLVATAAAIVAAASGGRVAAASRFAAAAAIAAAAEHKRAQPLERLSLGRHTHQTGCQHGSHNTALHGEAPKDREREGRKRKQHPGVAGTAGSALLSAFAAAVTVTDSDYSSACGAESRRAIVAASGAASPSGTAIRVFSKLPGRISKGCGRCGLMGRSDR